MEGLFPDVDVTLPKAIRRVSYRLPEEAIKLSFFHKVDAFVMVHIDGRLSYFLELGRMQLNYHMKPLMTEFLVIYSRPFLTAVLILMTLSTIPAMMTKQNQWKVIISRMKKPSLGSQACLHLLKARPGIWLPKELVLLCMVR